MRRVRKMAGQSAELVASTRITNPAEFVRARRINRTGDAAAWEHYDGIGEVHFALTSTAREASRSILKPVRWTGPKSFVDDPQGEDLVAALQSRNGGTAGLISSFFLNRKVTGDGFLLGYPMSAEDGGDMGGTWFDFVSTDELTFDEGQSARETEGTLKRKKTSANASGDDVEEYKWNDIILSRIWTPHPRYSDNADGPLKAMETICDELVVLTKSLQAKITSRLAMAGILYIANSIQMNIPEAPTGAPQPAQFSADPLTNWLVQAMTMAIQDPGAPTAVIPIIMRGPEADLDRLIKWITMDREVFASDIEQRNELIKRILAGLDMRPEQVEGFSDANHWSAWSSQDVHLKVDLAPDLEALVWSLTKDYYWPQLRAAVEDEEDGLELSEEQIRERGIWFDLANLTVRPNKADSYQELWDRGEIGGGALRDATGATEEEAPDDEERVRIFGMHYGYPRMAFFGTSVAEKLTDDIIVKVPPKPGPDAQEGEGGPVGPGQGDDRGAPGEGDSDAPRSERPDA